jgi:hypothetical protein
MTEAAIGVAGILVFLAVTVATARRTFPAGT